MATIFDIDAENTVSPYGFDSVTTEGTMTFAPDAAAKYTGSYGFKIVADGTNDQADGYVNFADVSEIYVRIYVYIPTGFSVQAATGTAILIYLRDSAGQTACAAGIRGSSSSTPDQWIMKYLTAAQYSVTNFSFDTWHCMEIHYIVANDVGGCEMWIDGDSVLTDLNQTTTNNAADVYIGLSAQGDICGASDYLYIDNIVAATTGPIGETSPTALPIFAIYYSRMRG